MICNSFNQRVIALLLTLSFGLIQDSFANSANAIPTTCQPQSAVVYVTKTGKKYHRSGCKHLKSIIPIEIDEARRLGYEPCKTCKPN